MGALSIANVMGNHIGKEMLSKFQEIMHSKPNLISLCGIADDATEADLSGLGMDADDAIILASELPDKGVMTRLNISANSLLAAGTKALTEGLKGNQIMTELDISFNGMGKSGAIALADIIPGMGALTSMNISNNSLKNEGILPIAESLKVSALCICPCIRIVLVYWCLFCHDIHRPTNKI
jgi:hypothetical protein